MTDSRVFLWLRHLPEDERDDFFQELMALGSASVEMGWGIEGFARKLEAHVVAWKATAEVHADPDLLAALTTPLEDGDLVDAPHPEAPSEEILRRKVLATFGLDENYKSVMPSEARLLGCGLCFEEDGQEIHPYPECTWITPRYKAGSIITSTSRSIGARRWEVLDVLEQKYRVRSLFTAYREPEISTWAFDLCHAVTRLEWQKAPVQEGVIDARGRSHISEEISDDD